MHRILNLMASIILFLLGLASLSIIAIGAMWATTNEGRDVMWQGVVVEIVGFTIFITFIIGGVRQFRAFLRKGKVLETFDAEPELWDKGDHLLRETTDQ